MRLPELGYIIILAGFPLFAAPSAPVLQWVQQLSASSGSVATASAVDSRGNLYITGNTSALDFPAVSAYQSQPAVSPLTRVDAASGVAQKLYHPLLSSATSFAVDPQNPTTLYAASTQAPDVIAHVRVVLREQHPARCSFRCMM